MEAELVYNAAVASYDLGPRHPLRPERFTLAVDLMEAYGLVPAGTATGAPATGAETPLAVVSPPAAAEEDILRIHSAGYVATVREAGEHPERFHTPRHGLGTPDNPVFPGMHEAAALVAGSGIRAVGDVAAMVARRSFSVAGGLHHAHRDRAAGFCVYNDLAIGIARALHDHPGLRVMYVDIDAHHGDGVQEAFWDEPRVLTVSLHESGMLLFPGTGFTGERGGPAAPGSALNVPLPQGATDDCYRLAFDEVVAPAARRFEPDFIVAQCGIDAHHSDPLTTLGMTLPGYARLTTGIVSLSDEVCGGRLAAFGGGGYSWEHVVPRAWAGLAARLAGATLPEALPESWRARVRQVAGIEPPRTLSEDDFEVPEPEAARLLIETRGVIHALAATGPAPAAPPSGSPDS